MSFFVECQAMSFPLIMNEDKLNFGFFIFTAGEPVEVGSNLQSWQTVSF
jgi:hypothetical protein